MGFIKGMIDPFNKPEKQRKCHGLLGLFEALSNFDSITPTKALIENTAHGFDGWTFFVPYHEAIENEWTQKRIDDLMKQHGIETWGKLNHLGQFLFSVKTEDAAKAEKILNEFDIPVHPKSQGAPGRK